MITHFLLAYVPQEALEDLSWCFSTVSFVVRRNCLLSYTLPAAPEVLDGVFFPSLLFHLGEGKTTPEPIDDGAKGS